MPAQSSWRSARCRGNRRRSFVIRTSGRNREVLESYVGGVLNPIAEFLEAIRTAISRDPSWRRPPIATLFRSFPSSPSGCCRRTSAAPGPRLCPTCSTHGRRAISILRGDIPSLSRRAGGAGGSRGKLPSDLIALMDFVCRLRTRYRFTLDEAVGADGDFVDPGVISDHFAEGVDGPCSRAVLNRSELNPVNFLGSRIDGQSIRAIIGANQRLPHAVGVDSHQVHATVGRSAWFVGTIRRVHGIDVIENAMSGARRGPLMEVPESEPRRGRANQWNQIPRLVCHSLPPRFPVRNRCN